MKWEDPFFLLTPIYEKAVLFVWLDFSKGKKFTNFFIIIILLNH